LQEGVNTTRSLFQTLSRQKEYQGKGCSLKTPEKGSERFGENMEPTVFGELFKNDRTSVRIEVTSFKGKALVCVREYHLSSSGVWVPGYKGLNMVSANWKKLLPALQEAVTDG